LVVPIVHGDLSYPNRKKNKMISSETPDKLAEIIRDTWPMIYRPPKDFKKEKKKKEG
tara:strand:+ start:100 stop:270 length:171 start_codon:yes stop_codon:yes gene_type:complete